MSISDDSHSDKTLNRGPLALLLRRQYEFPFGINIVQFFFSIFNPLHKGIAAERAPGVGIEPLPQCKQWITSSTPSIGYRA